MAENTQTQFQQEGQKLFNEDTENDNSAASSAGEKTDTTQTQSQEGDTNPGADNKQDEGDKNFADHPRWKQREDDWTKRFNDQEKRHVDEIAKLRTDMETFLSGNKKGAVQNTEIPSWFGGDEESWAQYQQYMSEKFLAQAEERILGKINSKKTEEQKAIDDATTYFEDQISTIESDKTVNPQSEKIDRNKLLKFVLENDLVDSKGRWNYRAGYIMMRGGASTKTDSTKDKKNLASATTSENRAETKPSAYATSEDFQKPGSRPW